VSLKNILTAMAIALALSIFSTSYASTTHYFDNIIIFGDSLSDAGDGHLRTQNTNDDDIGNNTWVKTAGRVGAPITSLDINSQTHPLWVNDFIQNFSDLKNHQAIHPSRDIGRLHLNPYSQNIDYAYASAETGLKYLNDDLRTSLYSPYNSRCNTGGLIEPGNACVPGVRQQVTSYLNDVHNQPNPNTVFILWAGGNDFINDIGKLMTLYQSLGSEKQAVQTYYQLPNFLSTSNKISISINTQGISFSFPVYNLRKAVLQLMNNGVSPSQVYVINLPDLSEVPAAIQITKNNPLYLDALSMLTILYNTHLAYSLTSDPKIHLLKSHIIPAYDIEQKVRAHPNQYALTDVIDSCVAQHADPICKGYLFFNSLHPTTAMGRIMAKGISNSIQHSQR